MSTFAQIKSKVSRKLLDPNTTAISGADVGDAVNEALDYWKKSQFWFNEGSAVATMVPGQANFTALLPSDFQYEDQQNGFVIVDGQVFYTLEKKSPKDFDYDAVQDSQGLPYIYTYRNKQYECYFQPDQAYTLNIYYIKDYADLVNDSDTNDFTEEASELLVYEALSRLIGEDRQDLQMNNTYAAKADREAKNLKQRSAKQTGTGRLEVTTILD